MCHYCYLKELKRWARGANKKVVIVRTQAGYEVRMRPRNYRFSVEEEERYRQREFDLLTYDRVPDECTCIIETEGEE
jgi:hypothetical protein